MKVSLAQLKKYTEIDLDANQLAQKIGAQLGAVEEVVDLGKKYQGIIISKIVSCKKHPNADKLQLCKIDDGGKAQNIVRDNEGFVQVVCGAPNVSEGLLVAWLPPSAVVPSTFNKDKFTLESREIRGQVSNGMIASPSELAISDDHDGILEITEKRAKPGDDFARIFELDDYIIDIENKMFTHRPDLFGMMGVAREIAGISANEFVSPAWYMTDPHPLEVETNELKLEVINDIPALVPRFSALVMSDVLVGTSPMWLQVYLSKIGIKSINNLVDLSNFFMMETAQPIHIYDYDKVKALSHADHAVMIVRHPKSKETIATLSGKTITPGPKTMMIATDQKLICVGGAIGGQETEVDNNTKNIIIEAANWDMFQMRRTSMEHGIFTDAVTRFTKGQSPRQNGAVIAELVSKIQEYANGKIASKLIDIKNQDLVNSNKEVVVATGFINSRLGLNLTDEEIVTILRNVEFVAEITRGSVLVIKPPFWRTDIGIAEDIVEEVGRLYGYDHLPLDLPKRSIVPVGPDKLLNAKIDIRNNLSRYGANEVLTYSFVHGNLLDKVGQDKEQAYKIKNALSPELQYYRLSIIPSILDKVHMNIKAGYDEFALFEIGKSHLRGHLNDEKLPAEFERVALVFASDSKVDANNNEAAYFVAKNYLSKLLGSFGLQSKTTFETLEDADDQSTKYYEPGRSATIKIGDEIIGRIGEFSRSVKSVLKLPERTAGFELAIDRLLEHKDTIGSYKPMSKFPSISQDVCFQVADNILYGELIMAFDESLKMGIDDGAGISWKPIDLYTSEQLSGHKRFTFRVTLTDYQRTLTEQNLSAILLGVAKVLANSHQAKII